MLTAVCFLYSREFFCFLYEGSFQYEKRINDLKVKTTENYLSGQKELDKLASQLKVNPFSIHRWNKKISGLWCRFSHHNDLICDK